MYLRAIMREQDSRSAPLSSSHGLSIPDAKGDSATLLTSHPRFAELTAQYASELVPAGRGDTTGPRSLASELVAIKITNVTSSNANPHGAGTEKKLPLTLSIGKLRGMLAQLYGLDPGCQQLALRVDKDSIPVVLDDDDSSLSFYGAVDGSEIFVNEV